MFSFSKIILRLLTILLVLGMLNLAVIPDQGADLPIQPQIRQIAKENPDQIIAVIIRKADHSNQVEKIVERLGGKVTKDLHIINAIAAELPAEQVSELIQLASVSWVSLDAPTIQVSRGGQNDKHGGDNQNAFLQTIGVAKLQARGLDGEGLTVALLDSGVPNVADLMDMHNRDYRLLDWTEFTGSSDSNTDPAGYEDTYGHGSHVIGIIGGTGQLSRGLYKGVAPDVNFVSVKVMNDDGSSLVSDVVAGMQWVLERKDQYNIRVVNLSMNSSVPESYHTNPLCAAAEILWFNGIVVVVSSGNNGASDPGVLLPPANDPFVITVGAYDDQGTTNPRDDQAASFTAYGINEIGNVKPDVLAPGVDIVSLRGSTDSVLSTLHPENIVDEYYFRMSGTSMAAAVVSGAVTIMLQVNPQLNPDQVKYRLVNNSNRTFTLGEYQIPDLNVVQSVYPWRQDSNANTGAPASQLLWTGDEPIAWDSVSWNSVSWNSVSWNSVSWNSVSWNSVSWNSQMWSSLYWGE